MKMIPSASNHPAAVNSRKTHCLRGHAFTASNTYRMPSGARSCKACAAHRRTAYRKNGYPRQRKLPKCHPDRPHQGKGLCRSCYERSRRENRDAHAARLRYNFGLTKEQYDEILARQGGGCAICGRTDLGAKTGKGRNSKLLGVDHCHKSKLVRGILCHRCNLGIGHLQDDVWLLWRALLYLAEPKYVRPLAETVLGRRSA